MVGFLGTEALYEQEVDLQRDLLIYGIDNTAAVIREQSLNISPYSPKLRRSFTNFSAYDSDERLDGVNLLLGDTSADFQLPSIYIGSSICVPYLGLDLSEAYNQGVMPEERTVWYIGGRGCTAEESDWVRYNQRLLADYELDIEAAVRTALAELNDAPARVILNMDAIDPVWAPAVKKPTSFGCTPKELLKALRALEGAPIPLVQVCGVIDQERSQEAVAQTGRLAAELARELALTVFAHKLKS
ncbi:MAG: arginase family protein [Candidatus Bruticola sp.]